MGAQNYYRLRLTKTSARICTSCVCEDNRRWLIRFSGGKHNAMMVQLVQRCLVRASGKETS